LQQKIAFQLIQAQEDERQRIAKDLHDSVGQNILFLKNHVQNNGDQIDTTKLVKSIDDALQEIRNISKNLYPNQLEKYGLIAAVEALADEVSQSTGIFVSSDMEGIEEILNNNVKINFYRIIQEFVNNTLKHAEATAIRITAQQTDQTIELIVQDNGKGFDKAEMQRKANHSFGLLNMEERVKMLKGTFAIESEPGKGTKSTFSIPV
jgi:signal transduction histidine kinase